MSTQSRPCFGGGIETGEACRVRGNGLEVRVCFGSGTETGEACRVRGTG